MCAIIIKNLAFVLAAILAFAANNSIKCDTIAANSVKTSIKSVDLRKTRIFGPGIEQPVAVLPVRYFFIEPIDGYGKS